ncbi:hypothetical protein DY000_02041890 [Brassica cretica]|uniref:Uncharacterized protein n=1 Tax=Brassica cretica TaxID=69181 RepID=A0ABQ7B791_BRACR|nr:hypothetical protein DY000_02041890 [Brassica cretica]
MGLDRLVSKDTHNRYQKFCLRGFHRQTFIPENILELKAALNLIGSFRWRATVTHYSVFSPMLIREILANLDEGGSIARIHGELFQASSAVVNQVFDMHDDGDYEDWKLTDPNHSVSLLTGGLRNQRREASDDMVQQRLRLLYSLVMRKHILVHQSEVGHMLGDDELMGGIQGVSVNVFLSDESRILGEKFMSCSGMSDSCR